MGEDFSATMFKHRLRRVLELNAELFAIDTVLEAFAPVGDPVHEVQVDLGRTHPFDARVRSVGADRAGNNRETQAAVDRLMAQSTASAERQYEPLVEWLAPIVDARPEEFATAADALTTTVTQPMVGVALHDFALLDQTLSSWKGAAAEQFGSYFYGRVETAVQSQRYLGEAVKTIVLAGEAITTGAQDSLDQLAEAAYRVVDDQLRQRADAHADASAHDWMLAGALALSLVAAVPTGGASTAGAITAMASAGASIVSYVDATSGGEQTLKAASAEEVLDGLTDGLNAVMRNWNDSWDSLEHDLSAPLKAWARETEDDGALWPKRPVLTVGVDPEDFHHESAST